MQDKTGSELIQDGPEVSISDVVEKVCEFYNITVKQIFTANKSRPAGIRPRQIVAWVCKNIYGIKQLHVAKHFDMDHSTIHNGIKSVSKKLCTDEKFADELDSLVRFMDPRHRILEHQFKVTLKGNNILNLPQISQDVMELACDKKIPRVEVTFRLLRGTGEDK